jgi:uncharacterized protein involved in outer membrane biogenesis
MPTIRDSWNKLTWWQKTLAVLSCVVALYALFGFLLLPRILRYVLVEKVSPALNRQVSVQEIRYNPFTLTVDIKGFAISEKGGSGEFVAFDGLHANVELSSIIRLALVVREVSLDGPRIHIRLDQDGKTNFADLAHASDKPQPERTGEPVLLPLIVEPFSVGNGTLRFEDQTRGVTHVIDQINFQLPQFSSRKRDWETFMTPTLSFRANGAPFNLQGQTTPFDNSLRTEFDLNVVDLGLPQYWAYALASENLKLAKGFVNFDSKLVFERHEDTLPTFSLQGTIKGHDIELTDDGEPVLSAARTEIVIDDISILNLQLGLKSVTLESPFIRIVRAKDGKLNWMGYFTPGTDSNATSAENAANATEKNATTLLLQAPQMRLTDGRILFRDETLQAPFTKDITALELTITDLSTAENATTLAKLQAKTTDGEELGAEASFSISPVQVKARLEGRNLDIPSYSSYFKDALPLTLVSAKADARIGLIIDGAAKAPRLEDSVLEVRDLGLTAPGNAGEVQVKRVALDKIFVDMSGHAVRTGVLAVEGATVTTGVDNKGRAALIYAISSPKAPPASNPAPQSEGNATAWRVDCAGASLAPLELRVAGTAPATPIRLNTLQVGAVAVDTAKTTVTVGPVDLNLAVDIVRQKDGGINLAKLFASEQGSAKETSTGATPSSESAPAWKVAMEQFSLSGTQIAFTDETLAKPVRLDVDQIALTAKNLSTDLTRSIPLTLSCRMEETGTVKAAGDLVPSTLASKGSVTLAKLPLSLASAYVADAANIEIPSGNLGGKLEWRMGDKDQITGSLQANGFRVTEGRSKAEIAGFKSLGVQKITLRLSPLSLDIGQIDVVEPRGSFLIDAQGKTTLDRIAPAAKKPARPQPKKEAQSEGLKALNIATLTLKQGRFSFADKTLSPQYESVISPVNLTVTGFSLDPARRTELDLTAIIDGSAPITAKGWISPLKEPLEANSTVSLRNLDLVALSAYSSKFIAYPVTSGQLDWDMNVNTGSNSLAMSNAIKARQLELGDKVDAPGAADVPVKLGLALLRDMSGNIAINLPVKGDLADPQFSIGSIVMQAFLGLIVKAIASPFSLLASLVPDGGGEDMGKLLFPAGLSSPAPETLQSMKTLADVLGQRPGLSISIAGHADPAADRQAMADMQFRRKLQTIKYNDLSRKVRENTVLEELEITDEEYADLLWEAYKDESVEKEKNAIGLHKEVSREVQEAKLRELINITDEDLVRLAASRADVVKNHLVQNLGIDAGRIFLGETGAQALSGTHDVTVEIRQ